VDQPVCISAPGSRDAGRTVRQCRTEYRARTRYANLDLSLVRNFALSQGTRLELRIESFNVTNHVNFGLPVADLNSANFGRIFSAGPPRLMQFAA
jgi:hypothetical protein